MTAAERIANFCFIVSAVEAGVLFLISFRGFILAQIGAPESMFVRMLQPAFAFGMVSWFVFGLIALAFS